jgi:FkbM family methyltransferase
MKRGDELYTLGGKLINFSDVDFSNPDVNYYYKYGWEHVTYWSNLYHKELNAYGPGVENGDVFVDLGANIGMSSVCAEICGASKIYAVEPDPEVFKALEKNKGENWETFQIAISDHNGYIDVDVWPQNNEKVGVRCLTFDVFMKIINVEKIDYLKVDIEGWEKTAFKETKKETFDKIRKIFIEFHEGQKEKIDGFVNFFLLNGFTNYHVVLGGYQTFIYFWK